MNNMENLQRACVIGFIKKASEYGLTEQETSSLLKKANPLRALAPFLGRAAKGLAGDIGNAIRQHPRTGIAAKQLLNNTDRIVPEALDYLNQSWDIRAQRAAQQLAQKATNMQPGTIKGDLVRAVSGAAAGVPVQRMLNAAHSYAGNLYSDARRNYINALRRQGVNLNPGQFRPVTPPPTPAQKLISAIQLGLGRIGNIGASIF